jgi:hypothetical protein
MWTYYKQSYANGVWSLFREDGPSTQQVFHRKKGWQDSDELFWRMNKGDIDQNDVVTEAEANALIRSLK